MDNVEHSVEETPRHLRDDLRERSPILRVLTLVVVVVLTVGGILLFGPTSSEQPTGSVDGLQTSVSENLILNHVPASAFMVSVSLSTVDTHWAEFTVTPTKLAHGAVSEFYGYAHFQSHRWVVITTGTSNVGCATAAAGALVPGNVLDGFGRACPPM